MAAFYPTSRANEAAEAARTGRHELNAEAEAEKKMLLEHTTYNDSGSRVLEVTTTGETLGRNPQLAYSKIKQDTPEDRPSTWGVGEAAARATALLRILCLFKGALEAACGKNDGKLDNGDVAVVEAIAAEVQAIEAELGIGVLPQVAGHVTTIHLFGDSGIYVEAKAHLPLVAGVPNVTTFATAVAPAIIIFTAARQSEGDDAARNVASLMTLSPLSSIDVAAVGNAGGAGGSGGGGCGGTVTTVTVSGVSVNKESM